MLLVFVDLNHKVAQALEVLLLLLLLLFYLFLDELLGEQGVGVEQGQKQLAYGAFGEEEIVVGEDRLFIVVHKTIEVHLHLTLHLLVLRRQLLDLTSQFVLLEFVVFYYWLLQLALQLLDLPLKWVSVGLEQLFEVVFQGHLIIFYGVHRLLQRVIVGLYYFIVTSNSIK